MIVKSKLGSFFFPDLVGSLLSCMPAPAPPHHDFLDGSSNYLEYFPHTFIQDFASTVLGYVMTFWSRTDHKYNGGIPRSPGVQWAVPSRFVYVCSAMFARRNRLTMRLSEHVPVIKWRVTGEK